MEKSSKFYQINSYALLEYEYNSKTINIENCNFLKILNMYNGTINILNYSISNKNLKKLTNNVLDYTVQQTSLERWIFFDTEISNLFNVYSKRELGLRFYDFYDDNGRSILPNVPLVYDAVKVHILSGYTFDGKGGFILRVGYVDDNNNMLFVANIGFVKQDDLIRYHSKPIQLGNRLYDKYVEILVPSLFHLPESIGNKFFEITNEVKKFNWKNANIFVMYNEISEYIVTQWGEINLIVDSRFEAPSENIKIDLPAYDEMGEIGISISESNYGDYLEFIITYRGSTFENFLAERSKFNESYFLTHEIVLYEYVINGGEKYEILSDKIVFIQYEDFSKPFLYRPIIKNDNAIAYSIDYTLKIVERNTYVQTVKIGSFTSYNVKKYGRYLSGINIGYNLPEIKVINKNIISTSFEPLNYVANVSNVSNVLTNNFSTLVLLSDRYKINLKHKTYFVDNIIENKILNINDIVTNLKKLITSEVIYGQNNLYLDINEWDNYILFEIVSIDEKTNTIEKVNLKTTDDRYIKKYYLVLLNDEDSIKIPENTDIGFTTVLESNQLLYKIDHLTVKRLKKEKYNRFQIILEIEDNTIKYESPIISTLLMYEGYLKYDKLLDSSLLTKYNIIKNLIVELENKKIEIRNIVSSYITFFEKLLRYDLSEEVLNVIKQIIESINKNI